MRKGSVAQALVLIVVIISCASGIFGCWNKYVHGNKTLIDFKQNFTYAYIEIGGKTEKVRISTWKDWKDSDAIQVVDENNKVYYTHLNRVILSNK